MFTDKSKSARGDWLTISNLALAFAVFCGCFAFSFWWQDGFPRDWLETSKRTDVLYIVGISLAVSIGTRALAGISELFDLLCWIGIGGVAVVIGVGLLNWAQDGYPFLQWRGVSKFEAALLVAFLAPVLVIEAISRRLKHAQEKSNRDADRH